MISKRKLGVQRYIQNKVKQLRLSFWVKQLTIEIQEQGMKYVQS